MTPARPPRDTADAPASRPTTAAEDDADTSFRVTVTKDYLVFSAGHFITYDAGGACEPLHGHNYRTSATLWGDVTDDAYVYDFIALKDAMRELVDELDHAMLLPSDNPEFELERREGEVEVRYEDRRYVFPERDVVVLPVPNTTAEMLADHLLSRLAGRLRADGADGVREAEVEVEESFGQSARARRAL